MDQQPDSDDEVIQEARAFARQRLGPRSVQLFALDGAAQEVVAQVRAGRDVIDAVLGLVFERMPREPRLADEFFAHFLEDLTRTRRPSLGPRLRRLHDTIDLVQSVLGNLLPRLESLRFEGRAQFLKYLSTSLSSKVVDKVRRGEAAKRREDRYVDAAPEDVEPVDSGPTPAMEVAEREQKHMDQDRLKLLLLRLSERDARILALAMAGEPLESIAEDLGLAPEAARKARQRAVERAKAIARQLPGMGE